MSKIEKLVARFLSKPRDLSWDELVIVLKFYGFEEMATGKTGGSRRKFTNKNKDVMSLHKPHPKPIVKSYVIDQVLEYLKEKGKL